MAPRTEKRVQVYCARSSIHLLGLVPIVDPSACNDGELVEPAREAVEAFEQIEALLARVADHLVDDFTVKSETSHYLPSSLVLDRAVEVMPPDQLQLLTAPPAIVTACNESTLRCRKTFETMVKTLRINAHRALSALGKAVESAEPGADRDVADSIATELLEWAQCIGLADDDALYELWPRLAARVVEVERPKHHAAINAPKYEGNPK